ncbi:hypothetical protein SOASR030_31620 [Leminorella grimontii]|uniref:Methyltransferase type 11 domain-containing protein n=1 Tax=Leminorella grimontii TaxID=82981 RepID=A0AAV5N631_9GAMM|nr:methyltransferase domain-containing protein [Leminorella grimontii]KFC97106.1 SAM-dependent methyltransferase [Leminorella grimontii ATCC 33999 = DSM 5078]GKX57050.1 hypothetical protein SOASR030_31620 [Leminorella grimontii]
MRAARIEKIVAPPASWDELSCGGALLSALEQQLEPWWQKLFGFHLLKLGELSVNVNTARCQIAHHIHAASKGSDLHVYADSLQLPFLNKSIDACLLANTLAYSEDPHQVLREVDRVLIDDGWLIISGFNPISAVGVGKLVPLVRQRHPYTSRMFTNMRLMDWLSLLNYEVLSHSHFQPLPWTPSVCRPGMSFPILGCQSLIVARKRTIPLTINPVSLFRKRFKVRPGALGATKNIYRGD